ncbi:MAG: tyrosinase family protein [Kordiimonadaceae bacterium]|nr:tyrosinase family protein [Kordiimonadaceae bacterium]
MLERKNQKNMSNREWTDFIEAVKSLQDAGSPAPNYAAIAQLHSPVYHRRTAHNPTFFLAWHREYLWYFEQRLQKINRLVTIPYWDWLADRQLPAALSNAREWGVSRRMGPNDRVGDYSPFIVGAMAQTSFRSFTMELNSPHGSIHMDIGGEMSSPVRSPEDVLFWLHHSYIDKLWADWQRDNPGSTPGLPDRLLPNAYFSHTGDDVLQTSELGYVYV